MRDLCNTDKPLFAVLTKLTYSAYLNILWLVCSLPIVTIGASTTALFYVTLKMAEDRDDGLTRMFFKAFRENFKPATKLWLILLAVLGLTFLLGGSDPMLINGENYADWLWLKLSDMFVITSLLMLLAGIGAVCFGATRYMRKKQ